MFENYSIRQMQLHAAICLWNFCSHLKISHPSIDELLRHLCSIMTASNLADWERNGAMLVITGRGHLMPEDVMRVVPVEEFKDFFHLVECVVEVGIVNMYGATTEEPRQFLIECTDILRSKGIMLPDSEVILTRQADTDAWGSPITQEELKDILEFHGMKAIG